MINNLYKKSKGFTLIELILYISLFVFIFAALFASLNIFYSNKIKNRTILEVEQQGQIVSLLLGQEIRNAQSIISPLIGATDNSLSLEHLNFLKSPINFYILDNKLVVSENGDLFDLTNSKVLVENLVFENNSTIGGTQSIYFSFDISYNSSSNKKEYEYNKNFFATVNLLKK